jgi:hypothetical protein
MGDVVTLDVRDDGVGLDPTPGAGSDRGGFGLTAMRQRVSRVAGTLAIESEPGGGTAVSARVPAIGAEPEVDGRRTPDGGCRRTDSALSPPVRRLTAADVTGEASQG